MRSPGASQASSDRDALRGTVDAPGPPQHPPALRLPEPLRLVRRVDGNLTAAVALRDHLNRAPAPPTTLERVPVTKLLNPGRAYYEILHPLEEDLADRQARLAGSGAHEILERTLARGLEYTELWLTGEDSPGTPSLERITARIDAYEPLPDGRCIPTEKKTVGKVRDRPSDEHLEQLGMYCALLGVDHGRLLLVHRDDDTGASKILPPLQVTYPDLPGIRAEMARRRDLLRTAVERRDPSGLPACPWWPMKCKYRVAKVCDCPDRPRLEPVIARQAEWTEDPEFLELLQERARRSDVDRRVHRARAGISLHSLLLPRKVLFEQWALDGEENATPGGGGEPPPASPSDLDRAGTKGLERQLFGELLSLHGPRHQEVPVRVGPRTEVVHTLDGRPFLVKVRKVRAPIRPTLPDILGKWGIPDEVRKLALRAALVGATEGRAYVWNWKLTEESQKLQVFDLKFHPEALQETARYAQDLPGLLEEATRARSVEALPVCPSWMCRDCPYRVPCAPERTEGYEPSLST